MPPAWCSFTGAWKLEASRNTGHAGQAAVVGQKRRCVAAWLLSGVTRATTRWTRVLPKNRAINGLTGGYGVQAAILSLLSVLSGRSASGQAIVQLLASSARRVTAWSAGDSPPAEAPKWGSCMLCSWELHNENSTHMLLLLLLESNWLRRRAPLMFE